MGGRRVFWSAFHQLNAGNERPNPRNQAEGEAERANPPVIKARLAELLSTGTHVEEELQLKKNEPAKITSEKKEAGEHDAGLGVAAFLSGDDGAQTGAGQLVDHRAAPRFRAVARRMNEFEHRGSIFQGAALRVGGDGGSGND